MFIFYSDETLPAGSTNDLFIDPNNLTGTIPYSKLPDLAGITLSGDAVPPYISSITPPITPSGAQTIEIIGEYFTPITQLNIPGVTVDNLDVRSPNKIIADISKTNLSGDIAINLTNGSTSNQIWAEGVKSVNINADPYFNNIVFFLKRNLLDSSASNKLITKYGDVSVSSEQAKYGTTSIKFTRGNANYLNVAISPDFLFSADFTVETWIRWDGVESEGGAVLLGTGGTGAQDQLGIFSGGILGYGNLTTSMTGITANNWHHIAISRKTGVLKGFLNGVQKYSINSSISIGSSTTPIFIGKRSDNYHPWGGFIDSLRITKGTGRYTTNFNPETDTYLN